jgi:hypothetical protein
VAKGGAGIIWLSGAVRVELAGQEDVGWMLTPMMGNRPDLSQTWWATDTGCFTQPTRHDDVTYLAWLAERQPDQAMCLFATAPDVVGNAAATWQRGRAMLPVIRALGYRAALVAQNGIHDTPVPWPAFDVLFVGGDDAFKLRDERTWQLVAEARRRGKWTHMGRCNSERRYEAARVGGYDSADGTYLAFGPLTNLPKLARWRRRQQQQAPLPLEAS